MTERTRKRDTVLRSRYCVKLSEVFGGDIIHIIIRLILAAHTPDEGVIVRSDARMDRPRGRDDGLFVVHYYVARLLRGAHEVKHGLGGGKLEVHINFHAPLVRVRGKGVPRRPDLELGHAHGELTALADVADYELIDGALVHALNGAEVALNAVARAFGGLYSFDAEEADQFCQQYEEV